ncbi:MAG TPA: diacylglycerol kinase [Armatimonadota bacterium]|nr:diacylglycerol kinase [Armatimonadota bacterium]
MKSGSLLDSFRYAFEGVLHVFRTQRHMRFHFFMVVLVLLLAKIYRLNRTELLVLFFSVCFVLLAEMFNTAVEAVVDLITTSYHPLAKQAKDVAAGAVLIASINAVVVGFVLFLDDTRMQAVLARAYSGAPLPAIHFIMIELVILLVVLVAIKGSGQKGSDGPLLSAYAALGFSLATVTVLVSSRDLGTGICALLLAILLAQSRMDRGLSDLRAIFNGAMLGICLPFLLLRLLP